MRPLPRRPLPADLPADLPVGHRRFPGLDGLRAMAALAVFAHHVGFDTGASYRGWAGDLLARGDAGVSVFFALSGFLLYRPFIRAHAGHGTVPGARRFYWRRLLRIYPAYWVALAVAVVAFGVTLGSVGDALALATLTQIYVPGLPLAGLPQAWSLAVEVSFYALLPLYAALIGRLVRPGRDWFRVELAGVAVLVLVSVTYRAALYATDPSWVATGLFWLPAHLDLFAVGMLLAVASVRGDEDARPVTVARVAGDHPGVSWLLGAGAYLVAAFVLDLPKGLTWVPGPDAFGRQAAYAALALFLLLPAVFGDLRQGRVRGFLLLRPMVWMGVVSYGIYLWHKLFVAEAVGWTGGVLFDASPLAVGAVALGVTLPVAWLSHRFLEQPVMRRFGGGPV